MSSNQELTLDYGLEYWVYRVTGWEWWWWKKYERGKCCELFHAMHAIVVDYTPLIEMRLSEGLSWNRSRTDTVDNMLRRLRYAVDVIDQQRQQSLQQLLQPGVSLG